MQFQEQRIRKANLTKLTGRTVGASTRVRTRKAAHCISKVMWWCILRPIETNLFICILSSALQTSTSQQHSSTWALHSSHINRPTAWFYMSFALFTHQQANSMVLHELCTLHTSTAWFYMNFTLCHGHCRRRGLIPRHSYPSNRHCIVSITLQLSLPQVSTGQEGGWHRGKKL
jgi:hypothetical protein